MALAGLLIVIGLSTLPGQERPWSIELEPAFGFQLSDVDGFTNYTTVRPLLQLNYQVNSMVEPHLRFGRLWAWGPDIQARAGLEMGAGLRLHFGHLIPFTDPWTAERIRFYFFGNYALSGYSLDEETIPYSLPFGSAKIARAGLGMAIRFTERLGLRVDMGYAYRSRSLVGEHGRTGAMGVNWHL